MVMEMNKAGLGVEAHTRPRGTHDWRETPASEVLDARALKAAAQAGHFSHTCSLLGHTLRQQYQFSCDQAIVQVSATAMCIGLPFNSSMHTR